MVDNDNQWLIYLLGGDWNHGILHDFPETVGNVISSQLTSCPSFFRGVGRKTTNQMNIWENVDGTDSYYLIAILRGNQRKRTCRATWVSKIGHQTWFSIHSVQIHWSSQFPPKFFRKKTSSQTRVLLIRIFLDRHLCLPIVIQDTAPSTWFNALSIYFSIYVISYIYIRAGL